MTEPNVDQKEFWDQRAGAWERRADFLDAFADVYGMAVIDALAPERGERIVDIGCGPGTTAVLLASRVGPEGEVTGVDISPAMVAAATRRAEAAGATNARFIVADAQMESLGHDLDAAFSRFGVMFFQDPVAAFANIGGSLRDGGRLAVAVWGPLADNPWMFVPTAAAVASLNADLSLPGPDQPGPFLLSDTGRVNEVLSQAGFEDIQIERVEGSRLITSGEAGDNVTSLLEVGPVGDAYGAADENARQLAVDAVIAAIEPYRDGDSWRLPGCALKVTARRP